MRLRPGRPTTSYRPSSLMKTGGQVVQDVPGELPNGGVIAESEGIDVARHRQAGRLVSDPAADQDTAFQRDVEGHGLEGR